MSSITQMPGTERYDPVGASRFGNRVIVDGRVVPHLTLVVKDGGYDLFLDDRFAIFVATDDAAQVFWMVANALAVGAGYKWIGEERHGVPFAPEVVKVESPGEV